jgi:hypothetical protein
MTTNFDGRQHSFNKYSSLLRIKMAPVDLAPELACLTSAPQSNEAKLKRSSLGNSSCAWMVGVGGDAEDGEGVGDDGEDGVSVVGVAVVEGVDDGDGGSIDAGEVTVLMLLVLVVGVGVSVDGKLFSCALLSAITSTSWVSLRSVILTVRDGVVASMVVVVVVDGDGDGDGDDDDDASTDIGNEVSIIGGDDDDDIVAADGGGAAAAAAASSSSCSETCFSLVVSWSPDRWPNTSSSFLMASDTTDKCSLTKRSMFGFHAMPATADPPPVAGHKNTCVHRSQMRRDAAWLVLPVLPMAVAVSDGERRVRRRIICRFINGSNWKRFNTQA